MGAVADVAVAVGGTGMSTGAAGAAAAGVTRTAAAAATGGLGVAAAEALREKMSLKKKVVNNLRNYLLETSQHNSPTPFQKLGTMN